MTPPTHPRLASLVARAQERARQGPGLRIAMVYPCDATALLAAAHVAQARLAQPVLLGPRAAIEKAADAAQLDVGSFELIDTGPQPRDAALRATALAREGAFQALMKGSLHTDELMSAIIDKSSGLRAHTRISHAFVFDLPRYPKLLALADCVVNISPHLPAKRDILTNAIALLRQLGVASPKVGLLAAVEIVNPAIQATVDAQALVELSHRGEWPGAIVEGPFGFDNAISAESARIKHLTSAVAGDADLLLVPELNAGNLLYKSFNYIGGGDCAGLVLGTTVPVVLTSRADSLQSRVASVALAVLGRD